MFEDLEDRLTWHQGSVLTVDDLFCAIAGLADLEMVLWARYPTARIFLRLHEKMQEPISAPFSAREHVSTQTVSTFRAHIFYWSPEQRRLGVALVDGPLLHSRELLQVRARDLDATGRAEVRYLLGGGQSCIRIDTFRYIWRCSFRSLLKSFRLHLESQDRPELLATLRSKYPETQLKYFRGCGPRALSN
jgi:hypothetical protein